MTKEIKIKAKTPCYINSADTCSPYRLTPYVSAAGEIWLAAEGNGSADDIMLEDIYGWTAEEINDKWRSIDLDALRVGADEIAAAGDSESADYIRAWADTCAQARS